MKKTKNILRLALIALLMGIGTNMALAQGIFILDDDEFYQSNRTPGGNGFIIPDMPNHDDPNDYTPLGSGILVLSGLGMAYLAGKRRKNEDNE